MRGRARLIRKASDAVRDSAPVLHWMRREFRCSDNPGLLFARELAASGKAPLGVVICLPETKELPGLRQLRFLLDGLPPLETRLRELGIPLFLRIGPPADELGKLLRETGAGTLTTDFDPLRPAQNHVQRLCSLTDAAIWEVDSRNIVPCWLASDKKEYMARTIRPKIHRRLPEFLLEPPRLLPAPKPWPGPVPHTDWARALTHAATAYPAPPVNWILPADRNTLPGEDEAQRRLRDFCTHRLHGYALNRNDPVKDASSRLSPWLHFGFLSSLRAALAVIDHPADWPDARDDKDALLEELIVRRELSDNFCLYEPGYDSLDACANWARATLDKHRDDRRAFLYDRDALEQGRTHQPLWNAAQRQLVDTGFLHGYMRMYWAKKILEWSASPEEALATVIALNDRWSLDGMDSNGYAGAAWSVCGVHDRGWAERPVYGTIRYMNSNGARRKFDATEYVRCHAGPEQAEQFAVRR